MCAEEYPDCNHRGLTVAPWTQARGILKPLLEFHRILVQTSLDSEGCEGQRILLRPSMCSCELCKHEFSSFSRCGKVSLCKCLYIHFFPASMIHWFSVVFFFTSIPHFLNSVFEEESGLGYCEKSADFVCYSKCKDDVHVW